MRAGGDLVGRPGDRRALADRPAGALAVERVAAELDLPQPVRRADAGRERLLAHLAGQDRAGVLAGRGGDVDRARSSRSRRGRTGPCPGRRSRRSRAPSGHSGGRSGKPTTSPIVRNRSRSPGVKSSIETRWPKMPLSTSTTTSPPVDSTSSAATHRGRLRLVQLHAEPLRRLDDPRSAAARSADPSVASIAIARTSSPPSAGDRRRAPAPVPASIRRANRDEEADWPQRPGSAWTSRRPVPRPRTGSLLSIGACLVDDPERGDRAPAPPRSRRCPGATTPRPIHRLDRATPRARRPGARRGDGAARDAGWTRGRPGRLAPGVRRAQRPLRLDVRRRRVLAAPGSQPVRASARSTSRRCTSAATSARWSAGPRRRASRMLRALPGRPARTRTTALDDAREQAAICRLILEEGRQSGG